MPILNLNNEDYPHIGYMSILYILNLVRERQSSHPTLYAENVVVDREHVERWVRERRVSEVLQRNRNLRVVDSGEVARTSWLMLFWLQRKRVRVDTWVWRARVMVEWLHLVKVFTGLFLESVLTVQHQFERTDWTDRSRCRHGTFFRPRMS